MLEQDDLREVGRAFRIEGTWRGAVRHGSGHIHDTWVATFEQQGRETRYVHQAVNEEIFRDVPGLMRNLERVTAHLRAKAEAASPGPRWEVPPLVTARDGGSWWRDRAGRAWRTFACVERARTFDVAPGPEVAREAARAFGRFARDLADFDPASLVESIPRFHDLDGRVARLWRVADEDRLGRVAEVGPELDLVRAHEEVARALRSVRGSGRVPLRVAHNDTKVNNVLIDEETGRGVAVIDLDTVMPGTILFDYGDLVRTAASSAPEDERDLALVSVDVERFRALTEGYLAEAGSVLTTAEKEHFLLGSRFMALIIGVRFLTDHLEGDRYFRTSRPGQNLDRARVQLRLLASLEARADELGEIVARAALRT